MKLDARILKNPLTGFDFKIAKQFTGKSGYFGDYIEDFFKLDKLKHGELLRIDEYNGNFYYGDNNISDFSVYFLPDEFVNQVEPVKDLITLAQLLKKLEDITPFTRIVIYDESSDMIFDSEDSETFYFYEYWKLLEEKVCRFADTKIDGKRNIFIFMGP